MVTAIDCLFSHSSLIPCIFSICCFRMGQLQFGTRLFHIGTARNSIIPSRPDRGETFAKVRRKQGVLLTISVQLPVRTGGGETKMGMWKQLMSAFGRRTEPKQKGPRWEHAALNRTG